MTTRRAIRLLNEQKGKIASWDQYEGFLLWKKQTLSFLEVFFKDGKESSDYNLIYLIKEFPKKEDAIYGASLQELKNRLTIRLDHSIDTIKAIGVPKKGNFLTRLSEGSLIAILSIAIPGLFIGGTLWGKYLSDTQNFEMKLENKELKDSLFRISPIPKKADTIPDEKTNANSSTN